MNPNIDFIGRGSFSGEVASAFANSGRLDVHMMKPYWDYDKEAKQWRRAI